MIEILKRGTKRQIECNACGALLRYQEEDIKLEDKFISPIESYNRKYIICPQCNHQIILEAQR